MIGRTELWQGLALVAGLALAHCANGVGGGPSADGGADGPGLGGLGSLDSSPGRKAGVGGFVVEAIFSQILSARSL